MRLIDADALYEKTAEWESQALHMCEITMNDEDLTEWKRWSAVLKERSAFKFDISDAPTIDAVEVVRCRDCKWCSGKYFDGSQRKNRLCRVFNRYVEADDYCSHGIRKEPDDVPLP